MMPMATQSMAMPMAGLDYSQGKWFAPGEPLPPGFVATAHPEGLAQPLDTHAMSEMVRSSGSFVVTGVDAAPAAGVEPKAAAAESIATKKSKKSKKKKSSTFGCC